MTLFVHGRLHVLRPAFKMLLVMKLLFVLIAAFSLQGFTKGFSQKISINGELPLEKIFSLIEKQSGYRFFYDYDQIHAAKPVKTGIKNASVEEALNAILESQPFSYSFQNRVIVIHKKDPVGINNTRSTTPVPPVTVTGKVLGDEGEVLAGAVVNLNGTGKTAVTNERGEFTITIDPAEAALGTLVVTYSGYVKREIKIGNRKELSITLEKNIQGMKDVVITNSYSRPKRKEEVVGSISTVTAKELQTQRPIESFDKMLEGLAAGVQVQTNTELGTPVKINIRGQNSLTNLFGSNRTQLTASSQPLFIIDGVPVVEQRRGDEPIAFINNEQLLNPLAGINPSDIESVSILKDAAATSIYGANASNGVVIITTKRGKAGKSRMNVGYSYGWSQPINQIKWLNGKQYHELVKELYINTGRDPFTAELLAGPSDISTNWFGLTNRYANYHNIDFDLSGGNDATQFRLSGLYQGQQSIQKGNDYQKISFNLRIDQALTKKLGLTATLSPTFIQKNALNIYSNVPIIPNVPAYNADGSFFQLSSLLVPNPLAILAQNTDYHSGGTMNGSLRLNFQATKYLTLSSSFGISGLINKENLFQSGKNATAATKGGFAEIYDRTNFNWVSFSQAAWRQRINERHGIEVTAGFEAQSQSTKLLRGSGTGFTYYRLNELSNAQSQSSASSKQVATSYAIYGLAAYDYDGKYYLNVSGRYDAASLFGPDFNATVNSAIGAGWNISQEKFLRGKSFIDLLRLRLSYGTTGNSRIGSYEAKGIYSFSNTGYNGYTSSNPSSAPNAALGWEKGYKANAGIDFNFSKRFSFTLDFYNNITDDAISSILVPVVNGFTSTLANTAKLQNRGLDAQLSAQIFTTGFTWTSTFNAGYNKNTILEVKSNASQFSSENLASALREGYSTGAIWGFTYAGVDAQTGAPLYVDNKGITAAYTPSQLRAENSYVIGDRLPKLQGGFINSFGYKGVSLNIILVYSFGGKDLINYNLEADGNNLTNSNGSVNLLDRWQKPGDAAAIPKLSTRLPVVNSTRYVYDATFIKLGNVSVSYAVPAIRKVQGLRTSVFFNATNLAYWYKQASPAGRNGYREYRFGAFPEAQTFSWGARFNF
jgi:TonB-linked SusC/RagA family outer membrane protein